MTPIETLAAVTGTAFGLVLIWVLWCVLWRDLHLDMFRQRLFDVRNELFDLAAAGEISFDEPAYVLLRERVNFIIRFAHWFTVTRLAFAYFLFVRRDPEGAGRAAKQWEDALDRLPTATRETVKKLHSRTNTVVASYVAWGSLSSVVLFPFFVLAALVQAIREIRGLARADIEIRIRMADTSTSALEAQESALIPEGEDSPQLVAVG